MAESETIQLSAAEAGTFDGLLVAQPLNFFPMHLDLARCLNSNADPIAIDVAHRNGDPTAVENDSLVDFP